MSKVETAAQAHTNLNMFGAIASMLEGGCIYPVGTASATAQKIILLCHQEQQRQLRIYDKAKAAHMNSDHPAPKGVTK